MIENAWSAMIETTQGLMQAAYSRAGLIGMPRSSKLLAADNEQRKVRLHFCLHVHDLLRRWHSAWRSPQTYIAHPQYLTVRKIVGECKYSSIFRISRRSHINMSQSQFQSSPVSNKKSSREHFETTTRDPEAAIDYKGLMKEMRNQFVGPMPMHTFIEKFMPKCDNQPALPLNHQKHFQKLKGEKGFEAKFVRSCSSPGSCCS